MTTICQTAPARFRRHTGPCALGRFWLQVAEAAGAETPPLNADRTMTTALSFSAFSRRAIAEEEDDL